MDDDTTRLYMVHSKYSVILSQAPFKKDQVVHNQPICILAGAWLRSWGYQIKSPSQQGAREGAKPRLNIRDILG